MSGGKGGSQSSQVQIPAYMEDALKQQLERAQAVQNMGYVPYMGPEIAGFTQGQQQIMRARAERAKAMGILPQSYDTSAGMMEGAIDMGGGLTAYSSYPGAKRAVEQVYEAYPEIQRKMEALYSPETLADTRFARQMEELRAAGVPQGTLDVLANGADNQGGYQPPGYDMPYSESLRGIGFGAMNIPNPVIARIGQEVYQGQLDAERRGMTSGDFRNRSYDEDYSGSNVGMTGWSE